MKFATLLASLAIGLAGIAGAQAQTYPSRPITIIVPFAAGGPTDTMARILADKMKDTLGQPIIIENVTGAGSTIGTGRAITATPDGYTVIFGNWSSHVGAGALYPVSWHIVRRSGADRAARHIDADDRRPHGLPPKDLKELIAWLKANPGKATAVERRRRQRRAHLRSLFHGEDRHQLPVRAVSRRRAGDGGPRRQQIDLMCAEASQTLEHVRGGKIKAFVVMSKSRWGPLPDVPTMTRSASGHADSVLARPVGAGARRRRSSPSSTPRWSTRSPIRRCRSASPIWARPSRRATN